MACDNAVCRRIMRCKPLPTSLDTPLNRCISLFELVAGGLSACIGAGIFVLSGTLIKTVGPAACFSYIIGASGVIFAALCYAELAAVVPKAGGCFTFSLHFIGELPAFLIGWAIISDYFVGAAALLKSFSGTIDACVNGAMFNFFREHIVYFGDRKAPSVGSEHTIDLLAVGLCLVLTLISITGAKSSMILVSVVTTICVTFMLLITVMGFVYGSTTNWTQYGGFLPHGLSPLILGKCFVMMLLFKKQSVLI